MSTTPDQPHDAGSADMRDLEESKPFSAEQLAYTPTPPPSAPEAGPVAAWPDSFSRETGETRNATDTTAPATDTPTPRTDAIAHSGLDEGTYIGRMTDLARQLERELQAAKECGQKIDDQLAALTARLAEVEREREKARDSAAAWSRANHRQIEVIQSLRATVAQQAKELGELREALVKLIDAATKFTTGCNCQSTEADDALSDALDAARQAAGNGGGAP